MADRLTLQCYSTCARGLPATAEEWDVAGLQIEGGLNRQTVVNFVNAISKHLNNEVLIAEDQNESPVTMARLSSLLAFADAVGCSRGLLLALDAELAAGVVAEVQCNQEPLQLNVDRSYYFKNERLCYTSMARDSTDVAWDMADASGLDDQAAIRKQLAAQTEALLHLAHKLQLPTLTGVMHNFIMYSSRWGQSLLNSPELLRMVWSARVLGVVQTSNQVLQQAIISHSTSQLCSFVDAPGYRHLLKPIDLTPAQQQPITFTAELLQDLQPFSKGQQIKVEMDLFGSSLLHVWVRPDRKIPLHAQLVLGRSLALIPPS